MKRSLLKLSLLVPVLTSCSASKRDILPAFYPLANGSAHTSAETPLPTYAEWFTRVMKDPDKELDLIEAATVLASHRLGTRYLPSAIPSFLHPVLARVQARLRLPSSPNEKIDAINEELVPALRRARATELKWLHEALGSEDGDCVVNSLLYLVAGDAIGLRLQPVLIPSHSFVSHFDGKARRNIETTDRGQHWSQEEYRAFLLRDDPTAANVLPELPDQLEQALRPCTRRQFVAVLLCQGVLNKGRAQRISSVRLNWRPTSTCR
jgi:hypothetical protein